MASHAFRRTCRSTGRDLSSIVTELRTNLYLGKMVRGDKLLGIRRLARRLHASPMTVLQLYSRLQDEGFVEGRQRSGTYLKTLGVEMCRGGRETMLVRVLGSVDRKLRLLGIDADDFAHLLLRYAGNELRANFKFAFMASVESYELLKHDIRKRLHLTVPVVRLPPEPARDREVQSLLRGDRSIRCLLSPFVHSNRLFNLARAHHLYMIIMGLDNDTARLFDVPPGCRRLMVVGEMDCADAIRTLVTSICGTDRPDRITVAAVSEVERITEAAKDATEIYASPVCLESVRSLLDSDTLLRTMPNGYSQQAMESILFHYLFAP